MEQMTGSPRLGPPSGLAAEDSGGAASNCGASSELVLTVVIVSPVELGPASFLGTTVEPSDPRYSLRAFWHVRSASLHVPSTISQTALREALMHWLFELHESVHTPHKQLKSLEQSESEPHAASQLVLVSVGSVVDAPQPSESRKVNETRDVLQDNMMKLSFRSRWFLKECGFGRSKR
jgi:hypothetical protein